MAEPAEEDRPSGPARKLLNSADVERLVDGQVPHVQDGQGALCPRYDVLLPEWRPVYERLRRDPDGCVSAALNRLKRHNPALVIANLVLALQTAAAAQHISKARAAAAKHRDRARRLRELADEYEVDHPPASIVIAACDLRAQAAEEDRNAERIERDLDAGPWTRKCGAQRTATVGAAARALARRLFGVADVGNALRSTVRTNTRSKAKNPRERAFSKNPC